MDYNKAPIQGGNALSKMDWGKMVAIFNSLSLEDQQKYFDSLSPEQKIAYNTLIMSNPYNLLVALKDQHDSITGLTATPMNTPAESTRLTLKNPEQKFSLQPL